MINRIVQKIQRLPNLMSQIFFTNRQVFDLRSEVVTYNLCKSLDKPYLLHSPRTQCHIRFPQEITTAALLVMVVHVRSHSFISFSFGRAGATMFPSAL